VTFADGDTTPKTINIPTNTDGTPEGPENFTVTLSGPTAGSLGAPATATVTIFDPSTIPVFGPLVKMLLALFTAITGVFMINRNRLSAFFIALVLVGVTAAPLHAQHAGVRAHSKKAKQNKVEGILQSVTSSGDSVIVILKDGTTLTLSSKKLKIVDLRSGKRKQAPSSALAGGLHVKVVTGPPAKIKILG